MRRRDDRPRPLSVRAERRAAEPPLGEGAAVPLVSRLHVPRTLDARIPPPLIVALHGCRQNAADFAAGTQLDKLADRYGVVMLYPEQDERANGRRCWNWFLPEHQRREAGEPAALLAMIDAVVRRHDIDRERIFVCGLSAGAAMAAILAEQAPDVFAGVGLMAGVALHASHDVDSAYGAMRGELEGARLPIVPRPDTDYGRLRVIAWTGTRDTTVVPANAVVLTEQFSALLGMPIVPTVFERLPDGTRATWFGTDGRRRMEVRAIEHLGHAWSGGSFRGSFTNPRTANATEAMVTFFLEDDRLGNHAALPIGKRANVVFSAPPTDERDRRGLP